MSTWTRCLRGYSPVGTWSEWWWSIMRWVLTVSLVSYMILLATRASPSSPPWTAPPQFNMGAWYLTWQLMPGDSFCLVYIVNFISIKLNFNRSIVRDLDPTNELTFLRVKSTKHEVLVAPDDSFIIIVLQHTRFKSSLNRNADLCWINSFYVREEDSWCWVLRVINWKQAKSKII